MGKTLKHCWIVHSHSIMPDRKNGGTMMRLTLQNLGTQVCADTYICPSHRNAKHWTEVLQNIKSAQLVSNIKTVKRKGKVLIDADSKPVVEWCGEAKVLEERCRILWGPTNNYNDLFE